MFSIGAGASEAASVLSKGLPNIEHAFNTIHACIILIHVTIRYIQCIAYKVANASSYAIYTCNILYNLIGTY